MIIQRRQLLQLSAAAVAAPMLGACGGEEFVVSPDTRFPIGPFGSDSTAEEVTRGLDLSGKTALVTGCTSGQRGRQHHCGWSCPISSRQ